MARNMDTAAIFQVKAHGMNTSVFCPIMRTDDESRELAYAWAYSLAKLSNQPVDIFRNGALQITIPAQQ